MKWAVTHMLPAPLLEPSSPDHRKAHEPPASRLPLSSAQRPICRRQVPRGLHVASRLPSRHYRGPRLHSVASVGPLPPHSAARVPAHPPPGPQTSVSSRGSKQHPSTLPHLNQGLTSLVPGCGSHFSATCMGFNCPPIPWCLGGTVSASPAPQGLWTEASPDLGMSMPAHSSQGPCLFLAHGQAHVAEFILDDLWWDKTSKESLEMEEQRVGTPALTIMTKARSGPAASMQIKT